MKATNLLGLTPQRLNGDHSTAFFGLKARANTSPVRPEGVGRGNIISLRSGLKVRPDYWPLKVKHPAKFHSSYFLQNQNVIVADFQPASKKITRAQPSLGILPCTGLG